MNKIFALIVLALIVLLCTIKATVVIVPQPNTPMVTTREVQLRDIMFPSPNHPVVCQDLPKGAKVFFRDYLTVPSGGEDITYYKVSVDGCEGWGERTAFK